MKIDLPNEYIREMQELLGEEELKNYLDSFSQEAKQGLRVNTLKIDPETLKHMLNCGLDDIPWISDGFYYDANLQLSKNPCYGAGLYYLQEPSAMTPADRIEAKVGERILDLCAAPGGKSTKLACGLKGEGILMANDISSSRAKALVKNLELFGVSNFCVMSEKPEKLAGIYPAYFDKILVDAPCSGEGMFRRDVKMIHSWVDRGPAYYVPIQREILKNAAAMVKAGGLLMYSTCTFSVKENEENIAWFLEEFPEFCLVSPRDYAGFVHGFLGMEEAVRIFPHRMAGEGHFLALLKKKEDPFISTEEVCKKIKYDNLPQEAENFLCMIRDKSYDRIFIQEDRIYHLPAGFQPSGKIRYLRTGLFLGTMKKKRFEPSQALAMTLRAKSFANHISLDKEDYRCQRYLKGETLDISDFEVKNGWCLVCLEGYPLGWGKVNHGSLKNYYHSGWRWQ